MNNNGIIDEYIEHMGRPVKAPTHKRKARFVLSKDVESNQDEAWVKANPALLKKRGGPQPGSGPKPKHPNDKVVKCMVSMTRAHHAATDGDRSGIIRRALDWYPNHEVDYCIVGIVYGVWFEASPYNETYTLRVTFEGGAECRVLGQKAVALFSVGDTIKVTSFKGETIIEVLTRISASK